MLKIMETLNLSHCHNSVTVVQTLLNKSHRISMSLPRILEPMPLPFLPLTWHIPP